VTAPPEIDGLYPKLRPARVTVTTPRGKFVRQADEALGSRIVPLDDAGLEAKFIELVEPVLGGAQAAFLAKQLGDIDARSDIRPPRGVAWRSSTRRCRAACRVRPTARLRS